jgi:ribosomal protein S8
MNPFIIILILIVALHNYYITREYETSKYPFIIGNYDKIDDKLIFSVQKSHGFIQSFQTIDESKHQLLYQFYYNSKGQEISNIVTNLKTNQKVKFKYEYTETTNVVRIYYEKQLLKILLYDSQGNIRIINQNGKLYFPNIERKYYFGIFYSVFIVMISTYVSLIYFIYSNVKLAIELFKNQIFKNDIYLYLIIIIQCYIIYKSLYDSSLLFIALILIDYIRNKIKTQ